MMSYWSSLTASDYAECALLNCTVSAIVLPNRPLCRTILGISGVSACFRLCRARHNRKTFCSLLAQNGVSTAVTQRLLEHSSPYLTNKVYTNVDSVLRYSVEQLPIDNWLE